jgi:hypothetical protein
MIPSSYARDSRIGALFVNVDLRCERQVSFYMVRKKCVASLPVMVGRFGIDVKLVHFEKVSPA